MSFKRMVSGALLYGEAPGDNTASNEPWPDKKTDPRGYLLRVFDIGTGNAAKKMLAEIERQAEEYTK